MDAGLFAKMLSDKSIIDLKKLGYKYPQTDLKEFVALLDSGFYKPLPLKDFNGKNLVYLDSVAQVQLSAAKVLLTPQSSSQIYGRKAMEDEILSTFSIEQIDTSRDSVRRILSGYAPVSESENRIYGMKKGLEFISDPQHTISEESIHQLYELTIGAFLPEEDQLLPGHKYRHDSVYIVGDKVEHTGLWYLVQQRYSSALFVPLSEYVEKSRRSYYNAYTLTEQNAKISGVMDVTPFLSYFIENVYHKLVSALPDPNTTETFQNALSRGDVTEKEQALWQFVLTAYGEGQFSTKQLEKDFGNAAYATIRGFVLKFEKLGLLRSAKYGNRIKYQIAK